MQLVAPCPLPLAPCTLHLAPCPLPLAPCTLHLAPCTLHLAPCTTDTGSSPPPTGATADHKVPGQHEVGRAPSRFWICHVSGIRVYEAFAFPDTPPLAPASLFPPSSPSRKAIFVLSQTSASKSAAARTPRTGRARSGAKICPLNSDTLEQIPDYDESINRGGLTCAFQDRPRITWAPRGRPAPFS